MQGPDDLPGYYVNAPPRDSWTPFDRLSWFANDRRAVQHTIQSGRLLGAAIRLCCHTGNSGQQRPRWLQGKAPAGRVLEVYSVLTGFKIYHTCSWFAGRRSFKDQRVTAIKVGTWEKLRRKSGSYLSARGQAGIT